MTRLVEGREGLRVVRATRLWWLRARLCGPLWFLACGSSGGTAANINSQDGNAVLIADVGSVAPPLDVGSGGEDPKDAAATLEDATTTSAFDGAVVNACGSPPALRVASGSTKKVCQLTGQTDRQLGTPTPNRTATRFNLAGTDLGSSFEHAGKLWFLFGDTLPTPAGATAIKYSAWQDSVASTMDTDPTSCVSLDFDATTVGGVQYYRPPTVPGLGQGVFDVPVAGLSTGASAYVWFSTNCMSTSVLARTDDDLKSFTKVLTFSDCQCGASCNADPVAPRPTVDPATCNNIDSCHFVTVQPRIVPAARATKLPGFNPAKPADQLLLFGSGPYRRSDVTLATVPLAQIETKSAYRYFAGVDPVTCAPKFVASEAAATPLFSTDGERPGEAACVGELSVHYDDHLGLWLAFYNCDDKISVRAARDPWGPFTAYDAKTSVVMDPKKVGYCQFIYEADSMCDQLSDPKGGGNNGLGDSGSVYGAYPIPRYSVPTATGTRLFFTVSTHNPYNVMLMQTDLEAPP